MAMSEQDQGMGGKWSAAVYAYVNGRGTVGALMKAGSNLAARVQELEATTERQQQANDILDDQLGIVAARVQELEREVATLKKPRCCIHCLGDVEPNGKCKNDNCIGSEFSYDDPHGWPDRS